VGWSKDMPIGLVAGVASGLAMDRITTFFQERQSASSRQREDQLREEMPTATLARLMAEGAGTKLDDERAEKLGTWLHYGLGASGGPIAVSLVRRGVHPLPAGIAAGLGMFVFVDEGLNYVLGLTPPAPEWPLVSHVRGLVGHLAYGVILGSLLVLARRTVRLGRPG
jgi:hypothetical protein